MSEVIIRDFDPSRDRTALRDCFVDLQNYEGQLDRGKPEGSTIAEAYLNRMFARCLDWDGRVFVAEVAGHVIGFTCVWARVQPDELDENPAEYAFVSDLVVGTTYRRRGIGSQLLSAAEDYALERKGPRRSASGSWPATPPLGVFMSWLVFTSTRSS